VTIRIDQLQKASYRSTGQTSISLNSAKSAGRRTAFLCHSHSDAALVKGLVQILKEQGWNIYVDWMDSTMPPKPNRTTANNIKNRIIQTEWFLFLATANSMSSRWCPWEIGYADGKKPIEKIVIIPTSSGQTNHGNEYLDLYRRAIWADGGKLAVFDPGATSGTYVSSLNN